MFYIRYRMHITTSGLDHQPSAPRHLSFFTTSLGASRSPKLVARWPRCSCWKGKQLRSSRGKERYASGRLVFVGDSTGSSNFFPEENPFNRKKWGTWFEATSGKKDLKVPNLMDSFEGKSARNLTVFIPNMRDSCNMSIKPFD